MVYSGNEAFVFCTVRKSKKKHEQAYCSINNAPSFTGKLIANGSPLVKYRLGTKSPVMKVVLS